MPAPTRAILLGLLLPALAGCIALPTALESPGSPARLDTDAWKTALSDPVYEATVSTVHYIAASDGTQLSLTLTLPEGLAQDAQVPTLLEITPYQAGRTSTPLTGTAPPGATWSWYVERGAAYVQADARGTNGSGGCLDFGGSKDREDAASFVAWIREQPWSNGIVVTDGISHPGMGSVVAHTAVPDLTAALAHAPVVSYYRDEWYQGAKFEDQGNGPGYQFVELDPAMQLTAEALMAQVAPCTGETYLDYGHDDGRFDEHWADRDLARHVEQARAPILLTQGFIDQNVHPDHVQAYWDALPSDFPKHVIWGWWYHGWPDMDGHEAKSNDRHPFWDLRHRWLDAALFGRDNGLAQEARVLVEDSKGIWHEGREWPLEGSEEITLHATSDGGLATQPGAGGEATFQDLLRPRRGSWEGASVVFRSEPLNASRLVNGAPAVQLVAGSSASAMRFAVYLLDEAPDGRWDRVTHGYVDGRTWRGEGTWQDMAPGTAYTYEVQLMPTAVVLEPGHRLTLLVASQDSRYNGNLPLGLGENTFCWDDYAGGCYNPSGIRPADGTGKATNAVHVGDGGTSVRLAWVDPELTARAPR